ncbi:MAG: S9 family peptidase [Woeseiaceae bacterium]|nr:S9 family peptidase [Gammaproteobacteria bacterium]NNK25166.1 S9 family peptidase [Woeseiaceae bacterium]
MSRRITTAVSFCLAALFAAPVCAAEADSTLTIDRIFHHKEFELDKKVPSKWLDGGYSYTTVEASQSLADGFDIVRHDSATGETSVLVEAKQLIPEGAEKPLEIKDYSWSEDGRYVLISTNTVKFRRLESFGDYWLLSLADSHLRQVGVDAPPSSLMYAKFSPDSQFIAYMYLNNIYIESIDGRTIRQLTHDGSDLIVNGTGDWVNEEEFGLRDGFKWSPDSKQLCYWQFDTEGVGTFYMIRNTDDVYSQPIPLQYPKAGTTNSAVRVGVVDIESAETVWVKLTGDPRQDYVPQMDWADSSEQLIIQYVNRLQNRNEVLIANAADGSVQHIFTDEDDAWLDVNEDVKWLAGGKYFTWLSERDGWRHLYIVSRDGEEVRLVTPGEFDIIQVDHIDTANGWVYYTASPDDPVARYLFRSPLTGEPEVERLTPGSEPAFHEYEIAPNSKWAFRTFSTLNKPPTVDIVSLPGHTSQRIIVDNDKVEKLLQATSRVETEFFEVDIGDGVVLDAWMMKPPDFDPRKKYPLLMHVYGEPAGQTVIQRWRPGRGERHLWHVMLAQQGYVVASVDNRGTPAPRGRAWRKSIYGQVGILASADQAEAVRTLLTERPYLDPQRVGSWGWSGGGQMTLNAMFRYPDLYRTGIALAFVSDQRLYDTIYQERYMGLPEDNAEGYEQGSPITHAAGLKGKLLIIHGTADDNVHYQNTEQLVDKLIALNKTFTFMMYPDRSHSIDEKPNTKRHLYTLMTNFLHEHLPLEARPE